MKTISNDMISYDEMAIRRLHEEVVASFNSLNLEKLLSLHADNIILMEPGMPLISGKQEMKKLFNRFRREHIVLKLFFNIREVEVFGKRAFVRQVCCRLLLRPALLLQMHLYTAYLSRNSRTLFINETLLLVNGWSVCQTS